MNPILEHLEDIKLLKRKELQFSEYLKKIQTEIKKEIDVFYGTCSHMHADGSSSINRSQGENSAFYSECYYCHKFFQTLNLKVTKEMVDDLLEPIPMDYNLEFGIIDPLGLLTIYNNE